MSPNLSRKVEERERFTDLKSEDIKIGTFLPFLLAVYPIMQNLNTGPINKNVQDCDIRIGKQIKELCDMRDDCCEGFLKETRSFIFFRIFVHMLMFFIFLSRYF